jgi:dihydroorotate dehydrogenase electron transfer subunit
MIETRALVLDNLPLTEDIFKLHLLVPEIAAGVRGGQFVHLEVPGFSLRRPFTVADADEQSITLVIRRLGAGTAALAGIERGSSLAILGPLGRGFTPEKGRPLLLGGGIGAAALTLLARQLGECTFVMGGPNARELWLETLALPPGVGVGWATEDGSRGFAGNLVQYAAANLVPGLWVAACGPEPMLSGLQALLRERGLAGQFALEARMACGLGACNGCVVPTRQGNARVCRDGPVFAAQEVVFP